MSNQMSFRWMFGDGSLLSASNPLRWSAYLKPDELCDQLCRETRPIVVEPHGGSRWPPLSPGECLRRLAEPVRQQRVQLALMREQESARAHQAALARLSEFKRAVGEEAAGRTDAFFLRFLRFNETFHKGKKPGEALVMVRNFLSFMRVQREKGRLEGLGLAMIRPFLSRGFVRILEGARDREGRRVVLTFPLDMEKKVPDAMRTRLYIYLFLKLCCWEDAISPGWMILHDMSGVTLERLTAQLLQNSEAKEMIVDKTFPWILSKILFVNSPAWLLGSFSLLRPFFPEGAPVDVFGGLGPPQNYAAVVDRHVARSTLPTGAPYAGGLDEADDAALAPGLGDFYEPGMDEAEAP